MGERSTKRNRWFARPDIRKGYRQERAKELGLFVKGTIQTDAEIKTEERTGYKPLKKGFANLPQVPLERKGADFLDLHCAIMGFKGWLRGLRHKVKKHTRPCK